MGINEETRETKRALIAAGYQNCSVRKGSGSARGWIYAAIRDRPETREEYEKVYAIVKKASGREDLHDDIRTDYFCENISIEFSYRPYIQKICRCGATGTDLNDVLGPDDIIRTKCRTCGSVVI
jgi:hypothetical protein